MGFLWIGGGRRGGVGFLWFWFFGGWVLFFFFFRNSSKYQFKVPDSVTCNEVIFPLVATARATAQ